MPSAMRQCWTSTLLDNEAFLAYSKAMSAACLSWATTCIAPCDVSVGFALVVGPERRGFG